MGGLGTGRYLKKNGYRSQTEIMQEHVEKVSEICKEYNLQPMTWSDMFFRSKNLTGQYYKEVEFSKEDIEKVPENMDNLGLSKVCMWQDILLGLCDYNLKDIDFYDHYNALEKEMNSLSLKYGDYKILFDFYEALAKVLKTKSYMGIRLYKAYKSGDKDELLNLKDIEAKNKNAHFSGYSLFFVQK